MTSNDSMHSTVPSLVFEPIVGQPWAGLASGGGPAATGMPLPRVEQDTAVEPAWLGATTLDRDGRIALARALDYLDWPQSTRLAAHVRPEAGEITLSAGGSRTTSRDGYFRLPAPIRRSCRLVTGDRLLLVALPARVRIIAFTTFGVQRLWTRDGTDTNGSGIP